MVTADDIKQIMARNLRRLRMARGITQREVASMLGFKDPNYVSQWETGKRGIGIRMLVKLCTAFDVHPKEFFQDEDYVPPTAVPEPQPKVDARIVTLLAAVNRFSETGLRDLLRHVEMMQTRPEYVKFNGLTEEKQKGVV